VEDKVSNGFYGVSVLINMCLICFNLYLFGHMGVDLFMPDTSLPLGWWQQNDQGLLALAILLLGVVILIGAFIWSVFKIKSIDAGIGRSVISNVVSVIVFDVFFRWIFTVWC
jgi:hypothetical protein